MEIVMPVQPECVGYAEVRGVDVRVGGTVWDEAFKSAAHAALCVWADHPNRRFYAPSSSSLESRPGDDFLAKVFKVKIRYNLEPLMDRIVAEQDQIKRDVAAHRARADCVKNLIPPPLSLEKNVHMWIKGE